MAVTGLLLAAFAFLMTIVAPLPEPRRLPMFEEVDVTPARGARWMGGGVIAATVVLYVVFF